MDLNLGQCYEWYGLGQLSTNGVQKMAKRKKTAHVDLRMRMQEPLRASIEKAAKKRGVSMNAEAVDRLERSFQIQSLLYEALDLAYGKTLAGILLWLGEIMQRTGRFTAMHHVAGQIENKTYSKIGIEISNTWFEIATARQHALDAAAYLLEMLRPTNEESSDGKPKFQSPGFGRWNTQASIHHMTATERVMKPGDWVQPTTDRLGDDLLCEIKDALAQRERIPTFGNPPRQERKK